MSFGRPPATGGAAAPDPDRERLVRRGLRLNYSTALYNLLEGIIVAIAAGVVAGSVALVGFGVDSAIELTASGAAIWRLHADRDVAWRERSERLTLRIVGVLFLFLALYVAVDAAKTLYTEEPPRESPLLALPNVVLTPHLGASTVEARRRAGLEAAAIVIEALARSRG